jgi:hypothetical protein
LTPGYLRKAASLLGLLMNAFGGLSYLRGQLARSG